MNHIHIKKNIFLCFYETLTEYMNVETEAECLKIYVGRKNSLPTYQHFWKCKHCSHTFDGEVKYETR